jgi:uncharacterized membrane protein
MTDHDRDRPPVRETRRTTVIDTGDRGGGGGGAIALILLLIVVAGLAWFLMRGGSTRTASQVGVNVSLPKEVNVKVPDKIELKVPDVNVKTDKAAANSSR